MKKTVAIICLCSLLLVCFSSCSITNKNTTQLNDLFDKLEQDDANSEKIQFFIEYQDLHYELKESDEYDNDIWRNSSIIVTVDCNYELAVDENWYKTCPDTDLKTLNTAFFNTYSDKLSDGHFTALGIASSLYFEYEHSEESLSDALAVFFADYDVLKELVDLKYVNQISIGYYYSMPGSYFEE